LGPEMNLLFRIKICGVTRVEDARAAAAAGADAIGFNFYSGSPRHIAPEAAAAIRRAVPEGMHCVGVFVNAPVTEVAEIAERLSLDAIQIHGDEPQDYLASLRAAGGRLTSAPIIRAFRRGPIDYPRMAEHLKKAEVDKVSLLVDAFVAGKFGGGGHTIDWEEFRDARSQFANIPLILAGGLTADNVARAIATARPDAIDVASGVESEPGKKDSELVRQLVQNARRAFQQGESNTARPD
jgi:phosphoribosylanthranilate isomerase